MDYQQAIIHFIHSKIHFTSLTQVPAEHTHTPQRGPEPELNPQPWQQQRCPSATRINVASPETLKSVPEETSVCWVKGA